MKIVSRDDISFPKSQAGRPRKYEEVVEATSQLESGQCLLLDIPEDCVDSPERFRSRIYSALCRDRGLTFRPVVRLAKNENDETVLAVAREQ